jgi:hypothetical protein
MSDGPALETFIVLLIFNPSSTPVDASAISRSSSPVILIRLYA